MAFREDFSFMFAKGTKKQLFYEFRDVFFVLSAENGISGCVFFLFLQKEPKSNVSTNFGTCFLFELRKRNFGNIFPVCLQKDPKKQRFYEFRDVSSSLSAENGNSGRFFLLFLQKEPKSNVSTKFGTFFPF